MDYDKNRLEQELIYYIEKLDINEEKQRLGNHLKYFISTLESGSGQGKSWDSSLRKWDGRSIHSAVNRTTLKCKNRGTDERRTGADQRTGAECDVITIDYEPN